MNDAPTRHPAPRPRLLIIELDYHAEVLTTLCPILAVRFDLVLWTTDKIWKKVGLGEDLFAAVLVMPKKQRVATFWRAHESVLRSADMVYFNTLEKHFAFFAHADFECPTVMRIHNTNASLFPAKSIDWSLGNFLKVCFYLLRSVLIGRKWHYQEQLYRKTSALMLPSEGVVARMADALRKLGATNLSPYVMPFSSLGNADPVSAGSPIVFAVTGSVDAQRKDYDVLYHALEQLKNMRPGWHMEMIFLGWAKGESAKKVLDRFAELVDDQFKLTCFRDYVSQQTFVEEMARTQFLIAPMKLAAKHKIHREYYGRTKISGIENDALRYCKPVILPKNYTLPADLNRISVSYEDSRSLCSAMLKMIEAEHWHELTMRFEGLQNYKIANIADNFYALYLSLASRVGAPSEFALSRKGYL